MKSTVFIVDDDPAVSRSIGRLVDAFGFEARLFQSGRDFLEQFTGQVAPACLVLDMRMPGMSGLEVQQQLRRQGETIPIILITGHWDADSCNRVLEAGAIAVIEKPFDPTNLIGHINEALRGDRTSERRPRKTEPGAG